MSFLYFDSMAFTGQPSNLPSAYGMLRMPGGLPPWSSEYPFVLPIGPGSLFRTLLDAAEAAGATYFFWDTETLRIDRDLWDNATIDESLDAIKELYDATKAYKPDMTIGFYGFDVCLGISYGGIIAYYPGGTTPNQEYVETVLWPKYTRLNQRWNGSSYDTVPLSESMDFFIPEIYSPTRSVYNQNLYVSAKIDLFHDKVGGAPVYPIMTMTYIDKEFGKPVTEETLVATIETTQNSPGGEGLVMWGGLWASGTWAYQNFIAAQNANDLLEAYQSVSDGSFMILTSGVFFNVTGMNFTGASSLDNVATIIETAVNAAIALLDVPSEEYPYHIGPFHCSYHSGLNAFQVYEEGGAAGQDPPGTVSPPDQRVYRLTIRFFSTNLFGGPVIGTDISGSGFLNGPNADGSITPLDPDEWNNGWVVGLDWWDVWSSASLNELNKPANIEAERTPDGVSLTWD